MMIDLKKSKEIKKGIIIYYGEYPCDESWPNRIYNFTKIFELLKLNYEIIIPYPPAIKANSIKLDEKVIRLQKSRTSGLGLFHEIILYANGIFKSYFFIKKQQGIDFVLFAGGSFAICFPIIKICKRRKIKVWIDIVDENSKKFEARKSVRDYIAILNKNLFDKWLIPKFDRILVISDFLLNKYSNISKNAKIQKSVPTIIDIKEFDNNSSRDIRNNHADLEVLFNDKRLKMLYAGSIERPNGILFVLNCAAELILKHNYDFLIVIIILMGNIKTIKQHAIDLGIDKNLLLLQRQKKSDLHAIYKLSDILFLPEHGSIIANAGFPGKTAELLASGKPIISTIFSDLDKYLINGENAFLAPIGDHISYTSNLKKLLDNESLRKRIGENGRLTAISNFDYRGCTYMFDELVS